MLAGQTCHLHSCDLCVAFVSLRSLSVFQHLPWRHLYISLGLFPESSHWSHPSNSSRGTDRTCSWRPLLGL